MRRTGRIGRTVMLAAIVAGALTAIPGTASAGGGCHSKRYEEGRGTVVSAAELCFVPAVLRVGVGESVRFINEDPLEHMFTGVAETFGDYTEFGQGEWTEFRFDTNGVYPFFCLLHPGMVGAVVVGDGSGPGPGAPGLQVARVGTGGEAPEEVVTGEETEAAAASGEDGGSGGGDLEVASAGRSTARGWWTGLGLGAVAALAVGVVLTARRRRLDALRPAPDQRV